MFVDIIYLVFSNHLKSCLVCFAKIKVCHFDHAHDIKGTTNKAMGRGSKNILCCSPTPCISATNMIKEQSTNTRHRAVTKILSCQVYAISKQGIEQAGSLFGSILLLFPTKLARGHGLT